MFICEMLCAFITGERGVGGGGCQRRISTRICFVYYKITF